MKYIDKVIWENQIPGAWVYYKNPVPLVNDIRDVLL